MREAGGPRLVDRRGPLPLQRLLGADGVWLSRGSGEGLRRGGGDPVRRRGDRQAQTHLWYGRVRVRPAALPRADRDKAERARPGGAAAGLGVAGDVPASAPSPGGTDGQPRQARVHPGSAVDGDGSDDDRRCGGDRGDPARCCRF